MKQTTLIDGNKLHIETCILENSDFVPNGTKITFNTNVSKDADYSNEYFASINTDDTKPCPRCGVFCPNDVYCINCGFIKEVSG